MNTNLKAFLEAISHGEGTDGLDGYSILFGGKHFHSFNDHPNIVISAGKYKSTAAGKYQILYKTWKEIKPILKLKDFSPASQDVAAEYLIKRRGALDEVISGKIKEAVLLCNKEWASMPLSPYGQPTKTMEQFVDYYKSKGGILS